ncbi:MAG: hypothetical protein APF77_19480 [Clostridia bacterium BRH_c25]|nr:MAG: hypothetical protein APF77_19480 [Clostridia bacterium BRH_c25]
MGYIRNIIFGGQLLGRSRLNKKDFTRNRKVGFVTLVCMILNMIRKSTQLEVDEFLKKFGTDDLINSTYTKQSFSEARQKLSPEAFVMLNDEFVHRFYEDNDFKKYKDFRLLAIDGSCMEIPNSEELRKHYGYATNSNSQKKTARALSSTVYDVENKIVISSLLGIYDDNEREFAIKNMDKLKSFNQREVKDLILFDRGYPSLGFIMYLNKMGIKYVMRTATSFYEEVTGIKTQDENVEIVITKERAKGFKKRGKSIPVGTVIKLRVLKVMLDTGEIETLVTNLTEEELKYEESKELYFKRWGIETKFDELKNKFQIENFSGIKPLIIEQDFHATLLLSNIASIFEQEAEDELKEDNKKKNLKYEYKINKNILVGKLKNSLIEMILEENDNNRGLLYDKFLHEIKRNVVPVIKGRVFERDKGIRTSKHSKTLRRVL